VNEEDQLTSKNQVGRIAMRSEGEYWNAYFAQNNTMEDALLLGSIRLSLVDTQNLKDAYLAMISAMFQASIGKITGGKDILMPPKAAPECERSGNA